MAVRKDTVFALNPQDEEAISKAEEYIDSKLIPHFRQRVHQPTISFTHVEIEKEVSYTFTVLMVDTLVAKYEAAGWIVSVSSVMNSPHFTITIGAERRPGTI